MIAYICKNCHLHGVGVPNRIFCPNCGKELFVQTHYKGEGADFYDGTYEKVDEVAIELLQIVRTFQQTKSKLYISKNSDELLRHFFPEYCFNYEVDNSLLDFQMKVQ